LKNQESNATTLTKTATAFLNIPVDAPITIDAWLVDKIGKFLNEFNIDYNEKYLFEWYD
jgi:hypothetical protein